MEYVVAGAGLADQPGAKARMKGLGAVLLVSGSKAGVKRFLAATSWRPLTVYWRGEMRFSSSRVPSKISGFNVNISNAEGTGLPRQLRDTVRAFKRDAREFRRLKRLGLRSVIDFAIEVDGESGPMFRRFPIEVIKLFAKYSVDLEVSYYGEA